VNVSISDVSSFLRCRRAWDISSPNRQALRKAGMPAAALHVGTGVHLGLAEMTRGNDWRAAVKEWHTDASDEFVAGYLARVGCAPSSDELKPYIESLNLVVALLERYQARYRPNLFGSDKLSALYVEQPFKVEIPGTLREYFVGTWDAIVEDAATGELWIVEHKSFTKKPNLTDLQFSPQFSAYVWAAKEVFGNRVAGVLYDGIAKKVPTGPELLKSGKLSRAFNDSTDYMTYIDALNFYGLDFDDYADILARFKDRDDRPENPYWTRYQIRLTDTQVKNTAGMIDAAHYEMTREHLLIYPTFRYEGCFDCQVRDLCHAEQNGEDVQWLKDNLYVRNEGSSSFKTGREEVEFPLAA
jgi:hypothetical protein